MYKIILLFFSLIIFLSSCIGFGFFLKKIIKLKKEQVNTGIVGLYGVFFLVIILYILNLTIPISKEISFIIHLIGLFFFFKFYKFNFDGNKFEKIIKYFFLIISFTSLIIFKSHDDFPYYHLPYTTHINNSNVIFGLGLLNHGFKTPSSIFYLYSSTNLPLVNNNIIHIVPLAILVFFNLFLIEKIFQKKDKIISIFSTLCFAITNIVFYRIAEHGTDRSGQLLFIILCVLFLDTIYQKKLLKINFINILILSTLSITFKNYFIVNLIFVLFLLLTFKLNIINFLKNNFSLCILIFFILSYHFLILNFSATGCFLYPIKFTCITNLDFAINKDEINILTIWYELWAKSGAGFGFSIPDQENYIQGFKWIGSWIDKYFFNKVSDFLLGSLFIVLVSFFFLTKINIKKNFYWKPTFILLLAILLFEWFFKHPALRYGGYGIFIVLISYFFSVIFCKFNKFFIENKKFYFLIIVVLIFGVRNINRLNNEINKYQMNIIQSPYPIITKVKFSKINMKYGMFNIVDGYCWDVKPICSRSKDYDIKKFIIFKKIIRK